MHLSCRGVKPSVTSFNSLITAASDGGSYDALLEVGQPPAAAAGQACHGHSYTSVRRPSILRAPLPAALPT